MHVHFWLVTASFSSSVAWTTAEITGGVSGVAAGVGSCEEKRSSLPSHLVPASEMPPTRESGARASGRGPVRTPTRPHVAQNGPEET